MPLNTLRLNHNPSSHPNDRIVFIKPLPRPPAEKLLRDTADTFLRAIAAQCLPIMKEHHLSVTTLEEYEPNPEFIGRNFNNGEVIQLVLRTKNGGWVSFNMVQMVMMHELAHNLHMNHGKGFWATRNKYTAELQGLQARGYTGEGFWGGGRCLGDLREVVGNNAMTAEDMGDLQVCGGTFKSRRRKRKRDPDEEEPTWKEKRDRRIEKKFGKNGQTLGEDEGKRMRLEIGSKGPIGGKPRVAQSKRGRELRVAAALARFGTKKQEVDDFSETQAASDSEYEEDVFLGEAATDFRGQRMLDSMGFGMVKVCMGEDSDDMQVKQEMSELVESYDQDYSHRASSTSEPPNWSPASMVEGGHLKPEPGPSAASSASTASTTARKKRNPLYDIPQHRRSTTPQSPDLDNEYFTMKQTPAPNPRAPSQPSTERRPIAPVLTPPSNTPFDSRSKVKQPNNTITVTCPICSLANDRYDPTCLVCAHVLDGRKDPRHWRCGSQACRGSEYLNAGDVTFCGVCGEKKEDLV